MLIARVAIGLFLVWHYATILPFAPAIYSDAGMLSAPVLPSPIAAPWVATALVATLLGGSIAYALGVWPRWIGLALGLGSMLLWQRNVLTLNPSMPYLGFWFLVQAFVRDPRGPVPRDVQACLWVVSAAAYSFSGWTKLGSPSWAAGDAARLLLDGPLGLVHVPAWMLAPATWGVVGLELAAIPLALSSRTRPWLWLALLAMHVGLLVTVDLRDISWAMIAVHTTLFDPRWVRGASPHDGAGRPPRSSWAADQPALR